MPLTGIGSRSKNGPGTVVAGDAIVWYGKFGLAAIVAVAIAFQICNFHVVRCSDPAVLKRIGIDPALAGGVAPTTVTDVVGFLAILGQSTRCSMTSCNTF